jgi:hypothetical protein
MLDLWIAGEGSGERAVEAYRRAQGLSTTIAAPV